MPIITSTVLSNIVMNKQSVDASVTIDASYNAIMYGPITIDNGKILTISDSAKLKIKDISDA